MRNRSVPLVLVLSIFTCGIYALYWMISTKVEMNRAGAQIPTAFLAIVPIVNIYWMWRYCEGVEQVTSGQLSAPVAFMLLFLLGVIGMMIVQAKFNEVGDAPGGLPLARVHND